MQMIPSGVGPNFEFEFRAGLDAVDNDDDYVDDSSWMEERWKKGERTPMELRLASRRHAP